MFSVAASQLLFGNRTGNWTRKEFRMFNFVVNAIPKPGGSKRAFKTKSGKTILVDACKKNKSWRDSVVAAFLDAYPDAKPIRGPIHLDITFYLPRPKGHYGTGKNAEVLKATAPTFHLIKPDATKLTRSTEDALTKYAWLDDAEIALQTIRKIYSERPGAAITINKIQESDHV